MTAGGPASAAGTAGSAAALPIGEPAATGSGQRLLAGAALAAALALVAVLAAQPLSHDDLFWHLRAGGLMVDHGRVLHADPFSFTRRGAPWVTHEWGFSLLVWAVAAGSGLAGLVALRIALVVSLFALVAWAAAGLAGEIAPAAERRRADPALLAPLLAVAAWAGSRQLILRAALAGAPLLAVTVLLLRAFRRRPGTLRGAAIAGCIVVWANLHSGVVFGLALVALSLVCEILRPTPRPGFDRGARRLAAAAPHLALAAVCSLAALANANGVATLLYPFRLARLLADPGSNFTLGHFAGGWHGREGLLALLAVAGLAGLLARSRRRAPLPPAAELAAAALFTALAWASSRLALEMLVLVVPLVHALWARPVAARRPATTAALAGAAMILTLGLATGVVLARPSGTISPAFPSRAADFLASRGLRGRMFNHQNWGGYLGWRLAEPVFWDGRNLLFAPLVREVATTPFPDVARRYGVDQLVLSRREVAQLLPELAGGRWALVYRDDQTAVFLLRDAWPERLGALELPFRVVRGRPSGGATAPAAP